MRKAAITGLLAALAVQCLAAPLPGGSDKRNPEAATQYLHAVDGVLDKHEPEAATQYLHSVDGVLDKREPKAPAGGW